MRKSKTAIEKDYREDGEDEVRERDFAAERKKERKWENLEKRE